MKYWKIQLSQNSRENQLNVQLLNSLQVIWIVKMGILYRFYKKFNMDEHKLEIITKKVVTTSENIKVKVTVQKLQLNEETYNMNFFQIWKATHMENGRTFHCLPYSKFLDEFQTILELYAQIMYDVQKWKIQFFKI